MNKRQTKKSVYGVKIGKNLYKKLIKHEFYYKYCPHCRKLLYWDTTGNMTSYPEVWKYDYCKNCGTTLCVQDNSNPEDFVQIAQRFRNENYIDEDGHHSKNMSMYDAIMDTYKNITKLY